MSKIQTIKKIWKQDRRGIIIACFNHLNRTGLFRALDDKVFLTLAYRIYTSRPVNWNNPILFTEKIQWLKLHDHGSNMTKFVDKISAKTYVRNILGEKYVIPTLGVWDHFEEINFDLLPDHFVLKTSNGSGSNGVVLCNDKNRLDKTKARKLLENSLKCNTYKLLREYPYKNIQPKIFAEVLLKDNDDNIQCSDITDYKFFCFDGEVKYCQVIKGRNSKESIEFFDSKWIRQPFIGLNPMAIQSEIETKKPVFLDEMLFVARKLSKGFPFIRVDLYETKTAVYFGELTLYPASGFGMFRPNSYDQILGDLIKLPNK